MQIIALFGPTGVGKTEVALAARGALRARGEHPVAVSADALQVYAGLETLTGVASAAAAGASSSTGSSRSCRSTRVQRRRVRAARARRRSTSCSPPGATPIVVGGTGLYLRAALTELSLRPPPPPGVRERWNEELERVGPHALHAPLARARAVGGRRHRPADRHRIVRALELRPESGASRPEPPEPTSQLWSAEVRHPTRLVGLTMERAGALRGNRRARRGDGRGRRARRGPRAHRAGASRRRARRSASTSCSPATSRR